MGTRELAHEILDNMSEEQLIGFISLFKVYNISVSDNMIEREEAYENLRRIIRPVPDLDYDRELADYREEKYGA